MGVSVEGVLQGVAEVALQEVAVVVASGAEEGHRPSSQISCVGLFRCSLRLQLKCDKHNLDSSLDIWLLINHDFFGGFIGIPLRSPVRSYNVCL